MKKENENEMLIASLAERFFGSYFSVEKRLAKNATNDELILYLWQHTQTRMCTGFVDALNAIDVVSLLCHTHTHTRQTMPENRSHRAPSNAPWLYTIY